LNDSPSSPGDHTSSRPGQLLTALVRAEPVVERDSATLRSFPIVGIGASAGGLEAFRRLLGALPPDTGMAYVLVQHLDPCHESILAGLLSEATPMEVSEVKGDVVVAPNHVYVIPPSKGLILVDGQLKLVPRGPPGTVHMPIDSFLKTLAEVRGRKAIGVILSGMGSDGTLGLQAVEAHGGIAFAQEPTSARNEDMPRSAIKAGHVDFILSPEDIARELALLGRHPYLTRPSSAAGAVPEDDPTLALLPAAAETGGEDQDGESLARILELVRQVGGTDFSAYKKATLRRRIARRMAVRRIETLHDYARQLEVDEAEAEALYEDCLISVTSFFRDPAVFQAISERVLPLLLENSSSDEPLRVWVPGCATGEEVYSIAMCLLERAAELSRNPSLQIFATDLSEAALAKARQGTYLVNIERDVSSERLRRFFTKVGDTYQINKLIREMCVFARHDLTRDPPYSRMDLISCRNVLIYLEPALQEVAFASFHYALRPDGFLLVGPAETTGSSSALFSAFDEAHRIYTKQATSGAPLLLSVRGEARPSRVRAERPSHKPASASDVPREADRMLLGRFGPAGVVVDPKLRVLEFRGDTAPFLDHGQGKASLDLEHLLRKGLLMDLRQAVEEARLAEAAVRKQGLQVCYQDLLHSVSIEVIPIKGRAISERCLLILFFLEEMATHAPERPAAAPALDGIDAKDREILRLSQALARTTEYMHTLVREHESALEELQSTTEEALSGNEELQSLNEELQTAKEEIQSANEELATLNQELQDRNGLLARSNDEIQRGLDDANALVDTVPQPLVILDGELRIEKANVAFYQSFEVKAEHTRGRRLADIGNGQWNRPELLAGLKALLESGATLEELTFEAEFPVIGQRTMSLNARRLHSEPGARGRILLAIQDRTVFEQAERERAALLALEHDARTRAEAADQLKDQFVATISHELRGPLNVISGWLNVLVAPGVSVDPAVLAKALGAIGRGVRAQGRLISDLLDHSRIITGKVELSRMPLDLLVVAEAALVSVRAAAQAKDIELQLSGDPATSVVLGDADRLQQVFWNLFLNAVKFTPPGGSVSIVVDRDGNQVRVTVSDTGRGIPEEFLPHVFERFRQAESSSSRTQPGLGLGLTLVRELVELHGGTVHAYSAGKDQGAVFTLLLPIPAVHLPPPEEVTTLPSVAPESERPPGMRAEALPAPPSDMLRGARVLVVDDEGDARDAVVRLLERYGAHVRPATSVTEAMADLEEALPDVIVSDIGMPGEDGYELIRRVRLLPVDKGGALPLLALSAYSTEEHRRKVMQSGFQMHLEKPVAPGELVTEVARLAGQHERSTVRIRREADLDGIAPRFEQSPRLTPSCLEGPSSLGTRPA
jgi:two-component system CheB/CheR fusion protein